ncbi:MAG: VOC family protein, partial [Bacteroidales bacterium]|nr:VOC family protein [Bacteroidales bacterium]
MNKVYKPQGYNSVSPYFIVHDAKKLTDLLVKVFNATEKRRYQRPDGSIVHMEMQIDDSVIMMSEATEQFPPIIQVVHVYVQDVDDVYRKALQQGCEGIEDPKERED